AFWYMNGLALVGPSPYVSPNVGPTWPVRGTGDFNRDGQADLVLQSTVNGAVAIWLMNGPAFAQGIWVSQAGMPDSVRAVADMDNDGFPDFIFQRPNGSVWIGFTKGQTIVRTVDAYNLALPNWTI